MKSTIEGEHLWYLIIRYVLGLLMLMYGLIKILRIQFILPAEVYTYQLKELDGMTLTWAFLGFSTWFSILLGMVEFVPAILLLFKKTKLVGATLLFPTLLTVFLINNAYGFSTFMRVFTGALLLIDLLLLAVHYKTFSKFFKELIQYQPTTRLNAYKNVEK
jgi:hypothetical protein